MMETIRNAANNIAVKIIFAVIIISFIFTGVGYLGFGGSSHDEQKYIAKVDGEGISRAEFEAQAKAQTANAGGDSAFIKQLRRNILSYQVNNALVYKLSKEVNTIISNDQIKNYIRKQPVFFENGKFNNKKYLDLLSANNYTPDKYAESLRALLQQQQLIGALVDSSFVLPVDSEISLLKDQTRTVYAATINSSIVSMNDVKISTEDEQKYYDEHQNEFFRKERVKFKYIANNKEDYFDSISVSDEEVKREFNNNIKDYTFPAKKAFSVIFTADNQQANNIIKDLSSGIDFTDVIKNMNQSSEISPYGKNGSLGWFADDDSLPQAFKDANLHRIGEISKPIQVESGYLIVKLDDLKKSKVTDFDDVKNKIKTKLQNEKAEKAFINTENKIKSALSNNPNDLEVVAKEVGLELKESDWTYYNNNDSILRYPEVRDVAFSNEMVANGKATNKVSDMIPVGNDINVKDFVIQVIDYKSDGIAQFAEVQDIINKKLYDDIAKSRFKSTVDSFMTELNEKGKSEHIQFTQNYNLSRESKEFDPKVVRMVFDLVPSATNKRVYGVEYLDYKNAYIMALTKFKNPELKRDISSELLPFINESTYYFLINDIRSKAKIEIMPDANL
ncbi:MULTISPECIES: SurA N-terminal domain-containing protein [unclassified Gilliamella]|jgi:parvulin-like peptidyl-prolyl isomerase|uniref:SurA N-terminal domain-containing protein n=1 Tax=unclassified Gilliamella TaxID=2685620 RepID=UPI0009BE9DE1|nr:SurA N-terminal domain-containing protein [Gilliamella apicola]